METDKASFYSKFHLTYSVNCKNFNKSVHHNDYPIERNYSEVFNLNRNTATASRVNQINSNIFL